MRLRADPADPVGDDRHLLGHPPDAELLEAAQFRDLEIGVLHRPLIVQEDVYPAMPFQTGDRVDRNARRHPLPPDSAAQSRTGQGVFVEQSGIVGNRRQKGIHPPGDRLFRQAGGIADVHDRAKRRNHLRPLVADPVRRAVAAGAGHIGLGAGGAAAVSGGDSHAEQSLFQQAGLGVGIEFVVAPEGGDTLLLLGPVAVIADRQGAAADRAPLGRQIAGEDCLDHIPDLVRFRRAAGDIVIHLHLLGQMLYPPQERRQMNVPLGKAGCAGGDDRHPDCRPTDCQGRWSRAVRLWW